MPRASTPLLQGWGEWVGERMGVSLAADRERMMELNSMGAVAYRAIAGFEGAGPCVRAMTESPAPGALWNTNALVSRGDDESVFAVYKWLTDKVSESEATPGIMDIEPHCAPVRAGRVPGKVGARGLMELKFPAEGGQLKERDEVSRRDRDQVALGIFLWGQPEVWEVCNLK